MKEKLTKFSRGVFQYEKQTLVFSQESIELGVEAGQTKEGSFTITTKSHVTMKGVLTKTDHFLKLSETSFSGTEVTIQYAYDATNLPAGETHTGSIFIISNCGEYEIPYMIKVEVPHFMTELGKIRDLFQFTNLAKHDWLSAMKIFKSDEFAGKLLYHDPKNEVLYRSLMKSVSTSHAMEEFLISIHKKMRMNLTVDKTLIEYSVIAEPIEDKIVIYKDNWGYTEIHAESDASFIELEQKVIWSENFVGNSYSLRFLIHNDNLKPGLNYGNIILTTSHQSFRVEVSVYGSEEAKPSNGKAEAVKEQANLVTLTQNYLNFRMNRIAADEYIASMRLLLNQMYETGDKDLYYFLKTHLAVSAGEQDEIEECFLYLENCQGEWKEDNLCKYAAYQYFCAMKDKLPEKIEQAGEIIDKLYEEGAGDWRIFWFLMNVKKDYMEDARNRFHEIQKLLRNGVRSSIIYHECSLLYQAYPALLAEVSEEAIPVMTWMIREKCMTELVKQQYLLMVSKRKHFYPVLFHSLETLYEEKEDIEVLQVMLSMLIRGQKAGARYFKWYEAGIQKQVRVLQLYEFYMYSMEEDLETILPESLLTYFSLDCTLHEKKRAYLYANIISNEEKYGKMVWNNYEEAIHAFAKKELEKRVISQNLAILYEELCTSGAFDESVKAQLPYVMFLQELQCHDSNMTGVVVVHEEVEQEAYTPIEDGTAQIALYTDTAQIFLVDRNRNRHAAKEEYCLTRYLSMDELAKECFPYAEQNGMLLLYLYEQMELYHSYAKSALTLRKRILLLDELKQAFHWKCFVKLVNYYYDATQVALLDSMLLQVKFEYFEPEDRVRMMELCIIRGLGIDMEEQFSLYGYEKISPKRLLAYCCRQLKEKPDREITPLFLEMCYYVLERGKCARQIVEVLCQHFVGKLSQLIRIWKAAKDYGTDCLDLEEQIVSQSLFSETYKEETIEVFYEYNKREEKNRMVIRAYLSYRAFVYLLKDVEIEAPLEQVMAEYILSNNSSIISLAHLKVLSKRNSLTTQEKEYAEIQVQQYVKQNIVLPFFLGFKKHFSLPYEIANKYFVEYRCNANRKVTLHYALNSDQFIELPMKNCYQGIYVKSFVLFHGDKYSYYITEQGSNYEKRTETVTVIYEDSLSDTDSEYSLLNSLLVAAQMQDGNTVLDLMKQYAAGKTIVSEQFKMLD